ncbi:MAG TPA: DNA translocase FtsK [Acidimicrobiales bacterium]
MERVGSDGLMADHAADLLAVGLVALGVLLALGLYTSAAGAVDHAVSTALGYAVGAVRFALPPVLVVAGVLIIVGRHRPEVFRSSFGSALGLAAVTGLADLAAGDARTSHLSSTKAAGGLLGLGVGRPLQIGLGTAGAVVVLVAVLVVAAIITTRVSIGTVARGVAGAVSWSFRTLGASFGRLTDPRGSDGDEEPGGWDDDDTDEPADDQHGAEGILAEAGRAEEDDEAGDVEEEDGGSPADEPDDEDADLAAAVGSAPPVGADEPSGSRALDARKLAALGAADEPEEPPAEPPIAVAGAVGPVSGAWRLPPTSLLKRSRQQRLDERQIDQAGRALVSALAAHGVETRLLGRTVGPTVTRFELELGAGVKVARVTSLSKDIAYAMASPDVRILAPIPGMSAIGVEVPNRQRQLVSLGDILDSDEARRATHPLDVGIGRDIAGRPVMVDLAQMPHMLISGATGAGKSSCINSLITSVLMRSTPDQVRLMLVDPKRVELGQYNGLPHLLTPVVVDPKKAANALAWAVKEMERRYDLLAEYGMRDITGFNEAYDRGDLGPRGGSSVRAEVAAVAERARRRVALEAAVEDDRNGAEELAAAEDEEYEVDDEAGPDDGLEEEEEDEEVGEEEDEAYEVDDEGYEVADGEAEDPYGDALDDDGELAAEEIGTEPSGPDRLPMVLVVVDELNDLMMVAARDVEESVVRIAQMARAVGIHLVLATQRPSVDVITGVIKANVPSRMAFSVSSLADSRVILDQPGAERLIGMGDMLLLTASSNVARRIQGPWVSEEEVRDVVAFWRRQGRTPEQVVGLDLSDDRRGRGSAGVGDDEDELLMRAMEEVVRSQLGSTSMLQRKLRVGFARAGRLMDLLERRGIVGPSEGSKARAVLMTPDELDQMLS